MQQRHLVVKPGASHSRMEDFSAPSAYALKQYMGGFDASYVSAKDPTGTGSWTSVATRMALMGLEIDGVEVPSGFPTDAEIAEAVWSRGERTLTG